MTSEQLRFEPADNAVDFLLSATESLEGTPSARDLKYAILHLVAAVEILLKIRLAREHFTLLLPKLGGEELTKFEAGTHQTVRVHEAARRLREVVGLDLEPRIPGLDRLVSLRNALSHHGVAVSAQEVQANASKVLNFAITFIDNHLRNESGDYEIPEPFASAIEQMRPVLGRINKLVDDRMRSLSEALEEQLFVLTCPYCLQDALTPGDHTCCLFCVKDIEPQAAATDYVESILGYSEYEAIKDGGVFPLHACPDCGRKALIEGVEAHRWHPGEDAHGAWRPHWLCMSCADPMPVGDIDLCGRCDEPTRVASGNGSPYCENCYAFLMA